MRVACPNTTRRSRGDGGGWRSLRPARNHAVTCWPKEMNYYCNSLVTACCVLLACARALMPVWVRIWYFDSIDVAWV